MSHSRSSLRGGWRLERTVCCLFACIAAALFLLPRAGATEPASQGREIEKLIDQLTAVDQCDIGYATNVTGSKFAPVDDSRPPSPWGGTPSKTIRELVARASEAVPHLVRHLGDKRKTKLPFGPATFSGGDCYQCEYDWNPRTAREPPREVVRVGEGDFSKIGEYELPEEFTVTVGDLCFVALGEIVNRKFNAVRYQPSGLVVVNSTAYSPKLRAAATREWGTLTPEGHRKSLIADSQQPDNLDRACEALRRLSFYYPDTVETLALESLRKPYFCSSAVEDFVHDKLYATASDTERKRLYDEFIKKHGEPYRSAVLWQLSADFDRIKELGDVDWAQWKATGDMKAIPPNLLKQFFPGVNPKQPIFVDIRQWSDLAAIIDALSVYPSVAIDRAALKVFQRVGLGDRDAFEDDQIAKACARRLAGKGHDKEFEEFFVRRIHQIQERDWLNADGLKETLALVRGETFAAWLQGDQVTDAAMEHLARLKKLHRLYLDGPQVTDARLKYLEALRSLDGLEICNGQVTDAGLDRLQHLANLESLRLSGDRITDAGLVHIENLIKLERLYLHAPCITDAGLVHLKRLTNLRYLDLHDSHIMGPGLANLHGLTRLETLMPCGLGETKPPALKAAIEKLQKALPNTHVN